MKYITFDRSRYFRRERVLFLGCIMGRRLIADEVLRAVPLETLVRWLENCAKGLGYAASYLTGSDPYTIVLFKKVDIGDGAKQLIEAGHFIASAYGR